MDGSEFCLGLAVCPWLPLTPGPSPQGGRGESWCQTVSVLQVQHSTENCGAMAPSGGVVTLITGGASGSGTDSFK